jgi:hypothetical protein
MGVPTSEVGYTSATTGRGDHEVHKGHVVALAIKNNSIWVHNNNNNNNNNPLYEHDDYYYYDLATDQPVAFYDFIFKIW